MNKLNEERRKVAEHLRREDIYKKYSQSAIGILSTLYETITGTEDFSFIDSRELSNKLADLIDRPTCCNTVNDVKLARYDFHCSNCELAWAFDYGDCKENEFNYCPKCGAEIIDE